jgi:thioredoxin reductase (NADPH)
MEGEKRSLPADILLPFFGLSMELGEIANWGLNLENNHIAVHHATMQTNLAGIFAIGDIATYEGKLKLILTGFAEAAIATRSAHSIVKPDDVLHFGYSTISGVPKM